MVSKRSTNKELLSSDDKENLFMTSILYTLSLDNTNLWTIKLSY